ncbi:MAG: Rieske 2Fe-2S domain-containing protein [Deltaproteobacteria bacterium]|nr:Rieske 2Fe-2S domain-containing protein [Deltaproteobacteria bacterium]
MLTQEENDLITRVGPGTPGGALLRRYWYPIAVAQELTEDNPTQFIRILGEDLVLFKDKKGGVGLVADRCPHRGASLLYGRVEERGIACAYHGWLFDTKGTCLETPAEPAESKFHLTVKTKSYPVQKFVGLYWTYMGPEPVPLLPQYDVWARRDGTHRIVIQPQLDANWFQAMENSADPSHLQVLHQNLIARRHGKETSSDSTKGFTEDVNRFDFYETPYGLMKKRTYKNGLVDEHPIIFPNILRHAGETQIRVPMDDTHTKIFFVHFDPAEDGSEIAEDENPPVRYIESYKNPPTALHPFTRFDMNRAVQAQDHMAWETQGPISDRTDERLATADRGIVMLREMMLREIRRVQQGQDPMGVIRDPAENTLIDTKLQDSLDKGKANRSRTAPKQVAV